MTTDEQTGGVLVPTSRRVLVPVENIVPILDTRRFEHMQRIATVMANASLLPDHLKGNSFDTTFANCFMVVNQAVHWHMDPFAVARSMYILKGKLGFEGKLIIAALESVYGIVLDFEWNDAPVGSDDFGITVSGPRPNDGKIVSISGNVGAWKTYTKGDDDDDDRAPRNQQSGGAAKPRKVKANWTGLASRNQLAYRGSQEWMRLYTPGLVLGAYTTDELEALEEESRASRAFDVSGPAAPPANDEESETGKRPRGRPRKDRPENRYQDSSAGDQQQQVAEAQAGGATVDGKTGEVVDEGSKVTSKEGAKETPKVDDKPAGEQQAADTGKTADAAGPSAPPKTKGKPAPANDQPKTQEKPSAPAVNAEHTAFMDDLNSRIGTNKPLKDYIAAVDKTFMQHTTLAGLRDQWENKTEKRQWTKDEGAFLQEFRVHHKARVEAIAAAEAAGAGPAAPPAKEDKPVFDFETFLHNVEIELGKAKDADEVARFFDELTQEPLKQGLITEEQMENNIRPLSIEAMSRFDFGS